MAAASSMPGIGIENDRQAHGFSIKKCQTLSLASSHNRNPERLTLLHEHPHAALSALRKRCSLHGLPAEWLPHRQALQASNHVLHRISGAEAPAVTPTHFALSPTLPGCRSHRQSNTPLSPFAVPVQPDGWS
jgi:hypothetical protein